MPMRRKSLGGTYRDLPFAPDADMFLEHAARGQLTIGQQLQMRRVSRLAYMKLLIMAGLGIEHHTFTVLLNERYENDAETTAFSLGHEIGHTFHYDLGRPVHEQENKTWGKAEARRERFCDSFALRWVEQNGTPVIADYVHNVLFATREHTIPLFARNQRTFEFPEQ